MGRLDKPCRAVQHPPRMRRDLQQAATKLKELAHQSDVYDWLTLAALMLGIFLRVHGWLGHHISFWMDEAMWASRLLHRPLLNLSIRPIGFMAITKGVVAIMGAREVWFRLLPALGALGSLLLTPYVAGQLLARKALRLLLVLVFAIQPALVDYANEFKPYSWEVLVHLAPIALYLRFRQTQNIAWFWALLGFLPLGLLLAYNLAFGLPGMLLVCLWLAWRAPQRSRMLPATLASGAVCALFALLIARFALHNTIEATRTESYWGQKYDVFYERTPSQSRMGWTLEKLDDMAAFPGIERDYWEVGGKLSDAAANQLRKLDRWFWIATTALGVVVVSLKRRELLLVLVLPGLVVLLANSIGKWPLGAFRSNLFVMAFLLPLSFVGMDGLFTQRRLGWVPWLLTVAGLTVVPAFAFGFNWQGHKRVFTRDFYMPEVLATLASARKQQLAQEPQAPRSLVLLESHTWYPKEFYLNDHPDYRAQYQRFFESNFRFRKVAESSLVNKLPQTLRKEKERGTSSLWMVSSSRHHFALVLRSAKQRARILFKRQIAEEHLILHVAPKSD